MAGDEKQYWAAMAPLRQQGSYLTPAFVAPSVLSCTPSVDIRRGDNPYWQYCVSPALLFDLPGTGASELGYCFTKPYFQWIQRYLQAALRNKPPLSASAQARVLWVLDVWAHTVYGLLALNVDLRSGLNRVGPAVDNWLFSVGRASASRVGSSLHPVYQPFWGAQSAQMRSNELLRSTERPTLRANQQGEWNDAVLMPTPFFELPFDWISSLNPNVKTANPLWSTFYSGVLPWERNGLRLMSRGNKDAGDLRAATTNVALRQGVYQWRMMCLQDWGSPSYGRETPLGTGSAAWQNWWPRGMGRRGDTVTLTQYIRSVHYQQRGSKLQLVPGSPAKLYPTFDVAFEGISRLVRPLVQLDYDEALKTHVALWSVASTRVSRQGFPAVTFTDSNDLVKAHADAVQARAEAAITNPRLVRQADLASGRREGALEEAANDLFFEGVSIGGKQVIPPLHDAIVENPILKPWVAAFQRLFTVVVRLVGTATGGAPQWPLIPHPFVRSLNAAGWNTVADGSTLDVLPKIVVAIGNIEVATQIDMGVYVGGWQPGGAAESERDPERCRVVISESSGDFVTQCDDVPASVSAVTTPPSNLEAVACRAQFEEGRAESAYRDCIPDDAYPLYEMMCVAAVRGHAPMMEFEQWAQQLAQSQQCKSGTLWSAFVSGFRQRGNPLAAFGKGGR